MHFHIGIHITIRSSYPHTSKYPMFSTSSTYLIISLQITSQVKKWPHISGLPQLSKLFQLLQEAMLKQDNWVGCVLSQKQMQDLQYEINIMIVNLQCQKVYGKEFWQRYPRRVQSSIVHFYLYFKIFISTLIPIGCDTLQQASRKDKLTFSLKQLEGLVNNVLSNLKSIYEFMFQPRFAQEQRLIKQFFEQFFEILQHLPKITKQLLKKNSKIMQYICLMNPLEAQKIQSNQPKFSIRKKNVTAIQNKSKKQKRSSYEKIIRGVESEQSAKKLNESKMKQKNSSLQRSNVSYSPPKDIAKQFKLFKFKQNVRKHSFYKALKKPTITSYDTKDRTGSIQKQRFPSNERSLSFIDYYKLKRTQTLPSGRSKQVSFYVERRSRQASSKSIYQRQKSPTRALMTYDKEEVECERQNKLKKKKAIKITIKTMPISHALDLTNGRIKGWGILRQWFQERLAKKKLQSLMKSY